MQMRKTCVVTLLIFCSTVSFGQLSIDTLITALKTEIGRKQVYVDLKQSRIKNLQSQIAGTSPADLNLKFHLYNEMYHEYRAFIYDSAFNVTNKLIRLSYAMHDSAKIEYSRLKFAFVLMSSGMFKETIDTLKAIRVSQLPDSSHLEYYRIYFRLYWDLSTYNHDRYYATLYDSISNRYLDSALHWTTPGSYLSSSLTALRKSRNQDFEGATATLTELLNRNDLSYHQRAMSNFELSNLYELSDDTENAIRHGALAAINDIKSAVKETAAILSLARRLDEQGDTENAYALAGQALDDAEFYGARQRKYQIISLLPTIAAKRLHTIDEQRRTWIIISGAAIIIAILIVAFVYILMKQLTKLRAAELVTKQANAALHETNLKLLEAERIKEEYIGYYINNNATFIDKIERFKNAIERKVQLKKFDDIRFVTNTINAGSDRQEFFTNFDKTFLRLFPDFVQRFNALFPEGDKMVLKENQILNTEMRIFALHRLGIHDANKVAAILGYSINTIYSYKNRVKSKSLVPNDKFEATIMAIKSVEPSTDLYEPSSTPEGTTKNIQPNHVGTRSTQRSQSTKV